MTIKELFTPIFEGWEFDFKDLDGNYIFGTYDLFSPDELESFIETYGNKEILQIEPTSAKGLAVIQTNISSKQ
jgi:hypothetical protein